MVLFLEIRRLAVVVQEQARITQKLAYYGLQGEARRLALSEQGWAGAKECQTSWEEYRTCGRIFFDAVDEAHAECEQQAEAFKQCARRRGADCEALELALWQCTSSRVKRRMSGQPPPPDSHD